MTSPAKALFLDRDGVINKEVNYLHKIEDFEFLPYVFETCRRFIAAGYQIIIITNQAGIGRGYYSEAQYQALTDWMLAEFTANQITITKVYHCPHHPTDALGDYKTKCDCRKPQPGMLLRAAKEFHLDLNKSRLIGDKVSDINAGRNAEVGYCCLVSTGHALSDSDIALADGCFNNLQQLTDSVLGK